MADYPSTETAQQVVGHVFSAGAIIGVWTHMITEWMATVAALAALIWYMVSIYESKTVQGWLKRRQDKKRKVDKYDARP